MSNPLHIITGTPVSNALREYRRNICKGGGGVPRCPQYVSSTEQCAKCFCLVHLKTKYKEENCPLQKW